jgi:hypothetical protein
MKKRKFADGGETTEMRPSAKPEGGIFDEDTYARARRFVESGKEESKPAVKKARKVEIDPTAGEAKDKAAQRAADMGDEAPVKRSSGRAEIPIDPNGPKAPKSTGEDTSGPSNLGRILSAGGAGIGALGTAAAMRTAGHANRVAKRVAKAIDSANASGKSIAPTVQSAKSAEKYSPKQQLEAGESALRGATNRARLKSLREDLDMSGAGMKKGGAVKKYASGGMVGSASRRADGIAIKGKTKCRIV